MKLFSELGVCVSSLGVESFASPRLQHFVARNRITQRRAKKHVGREMRACRHTGKTDGGGKTVCQPGHPAMIVKAAGNNRGYGKSAGSVPGWERTAFKRRLTAGKKCIVKVASSGNVGGPLSAGNRLHAKINNGGVSISFAREYRG